MPIHRSNSDISLGELDDNENHKLKALKEILSIRRRIITGLKLERARLVEEEQFMKTHQSDICGGTGGCIAAATDASESNKGYLLLQNENPMTLSLKNKWESTLNLSAVELKESLESESFDKSLVDKIVENTKQLNEEYFKAINKRSATDVLWLRIKALFFVREKELAEAYKIHTNMNTQIVQDSTKIVDFLRHPLLTLKS
ncbi:hypothetical protein BMR1_02g03690 [Babesia microti strain RI]|uniref:Uncharacterized protein n=1 Tax=Babesia microti (strain RI) TaxID=1133968 RepID=I7I8Y3_BABMR|nr:hypothetical protein BMR1_02g03690 [Babesia microti strain RI]CCF73888.1 hypothetical protein BMR1_02g03690 [Babesia microti strain RI]|eukprot:XP_012648497.1 hypothetical protein BMR1_02g03690 [Babesia microti strain RI]